MIKFLRLTLYIKPKSEQAKKLLINKIENGNGECVKVTTTRP